ncbi:hypothetical protein [Enterobacter quasiroggenkampii]|uniref:DUF4435 domain-containing protein n=1 Tax=Enterobacter quasiroggenkampii TaxID=2497436 RepID=A0ABY8E022_9ENTR|nr:hypothetical protein [Enterobacter quasiroggenkampii]WFC81238.1 hypothetical protein OM418_14465 [Enterobacter quasiroggenkampii]
MNKSSLISPKVRNALDQARFFFTRKGTKTIFIEGSKDFKMLYPLINETYRLEVLDGKPNIMFVENKYSQDKFALANKYVMFMADVDYDVVIQNKMSDYVHYNVLCNNAGFIYNDLEIFLINTIALKKVLVNYGVEFSDSDVEMLKNALEKTSRFFGKYRAADEFLKKKLGGNSILNGFSIEDYVIVTDKLVEPDSSGFLSQLPLWANRKEYIEDLLEEANQFNNKCVKEWALSNGHDVTQILALFISEALSANRRNKISIKSNDIEMLLRVACEKNDYEKSPMGHALRRFGAI